MANEFVIKNGYLSKGDSQITGSLFVSGAISASYGPNTVGFYGTSSWAVSASWAPGATPTTPGGSNTQIQFNSASVFSGSNNLTFDYINNKLTLTGSLNVTGSTTQIGNNTLLGNTTLSGSIVISGALGTNNPTVRIYGDTEHNGYIRFDPVSTNINTSISASYVYVSGSTNDLYFSQNGSGYNNVTRLRWLEGNLYTGLLHGGLITTQSSTMFQIASGSGVIVNLNASIANDPFPTIQFLQWPNLSASIAPLSASYDQSFIGINSLAQITASGTPFQDGDYNTLIPIGIVIHQNHSTINAIQTFPSVGYGWKQRSYDFVKAFGPLKISGYSLSPSSSRGLLLTGGTAWVDGRNYTIDPNNPSYITEATGITTSKIFRYYQSGSEWVYDTNGGVGYTTIDPTQYSNTGSLTPVPANDWTIQRVFYFPNSATKALYVYYGNTFYTSKDNAIAGILTEPFNEAPNTAANAIFVGYIILRYNASFNTATSYEFRAGGLFRAAGGGGGGGAGGGATTLAGLSDVSITSPTYGDLLMYDNTVWYNTKTLSGSYTLSGSLTTNDGVSVQSLTASFVSASSITGSLFGTASYASNGGVTQLLAGPNITLSPTNGLGQVTITSTGGGGIYGNTATGSYGSFYSTQTQTASLANTPYSMSFNTIDISNGVSISGSTSSSIKITNSGVYNIQFSAQLARNVGSGNEDVLIWLRKNGNDLAWTNTDVTFVGSTNISQVAAWNWFVNSSANDYYEIMWSTTSTNIVLLSNTTPNPDVPSVILTVNRVDQFLSNTGSFTGSFTGELIGTASWAYSSSQTFTASYVTGSIFTSTNLALSASYALSSSRAINANNANYAGIVSTLNASNNQDYSIVFVVSGSNGYLQTYTDAGSDLLYNPSTNKVTVPILSATSITGSLFGTSSWARSASQAFTASFLPIGTYDITASWAQSSSQATSASYVKLLAGPNITINYQSNGIAITGSGGGSGTPGGSNTQIQFNSASVFSGSQYFTYNYQLQSLQQGYLTQTLGNFSHAEGAGTIANGNYSHAEGQETQTFGDISHTEGSVTYTPGPVSHAEGFGTITGYSTLGIDDLTQTTTAPGFNSEITLFGIDVTQYFPYPTSVLVLDDTSYPSFKDTVSSSFDGSNTTFYFTDTFDGAYVYYIVNIGTNYGYSSHAEGNNTRTIGNYSHAEGQATQTIGDFSHTEGSYTQAIGSFSHAEGQSTQTIGRYSHAEGNSTVAYGDCSHAGGIGTIASGSNNGQTVIGSYNLQGNIIDLFTIGDGIDTNNRHDLVNAGTGYFNISGSTGISGSLTVTGNINGTASWAQSSSQALTASFLPVGTYNITASLATISVSSSKINTVRTSTAGTYYLTFVDSSNPGSGDFEQLYTDASVALTFNPSTSTLTVTNITASLFGTSSWAYSSSQALTASYVTGSIFTSTNPALSASYALSSSRAVTSSFAITASYVNGMIVKSGKAASFSGTPQKATVTFTTNFPNTNYTVTLTGNIDARSWTAESLTTSSFVINSNSNAALTGGVYWQAISIGEFSQ